MPEDQQSKCRTSHGFDVILDDGPFVRLVCPLRANRPTRSRIKRAIRSIYRGRVKPQIHSGELSVTTYIPVNTERTTRNRMVDELTKSLRKNIKMTREVHKAKQTAQRVIRHTGTLPGYSRKQRRKNRIPISQPRVA